MPFSIADVERITRDLLREHFAEHSLPVPKIAFVNKLGAKYLARCSWIPGQPNTLIELQRSTLGDEKTLRRLLAHELIHHWQFLSTNQDTAIALAKMRIRVDGHGPDFMSYADRINATMGADYVTKTSDQSYDKSATPPFYILVQPHRDRFGYSVAVRPSAAQKAEIAKRREQDRARLFQITDARFTHGAPIKRLGGFALPRTSGSEEDAFLRTLYETGAQVTLSGG